MKRDSKSLIDLCSSVIAKNELFSKEISNNEKRIAQLEADNRRLSQLVTIRNKELNEVNQEMLKMAFICSKVELKC